MDGDYFYELCAGTKIWIGRNQYLLQVPAIIQQQQQQMLRLIQQQQQILYQQQQQALLNSMEKHSVQQLPGQQSNTKDFKVNFINQNSSDVARNLFYQGAEPQRTDPAAQKRKIERIEYPQGVYEGEMLDDKKQGHGKFVFNDQSYYEGEFTADKM